MTIMLLSTILFGITASLFSSSIKTSPVVPDTQAPDFELDCIGNESGKVRLSDGFNQDKTTVLVFSRASWCPFCLRQMLEFRRNAEKFEQVNAEVIFVFREESKGLDGLKTIQKRAKTDFVLALDNDNSETSTYSPAPGEFSTYIIDESGTIVQVIKGDMRNRVKSRRILDFIESTLPVAV